MVGFLSASGRPTRRQAWERMTGLSPPTLFIFLLASLIAAVPVSAQESAACDQYECAEEDSTPDELAPPRGASSEVEEATAPDTTPVVESEAPANDEESRSENEGGAGYPVEDPAPTPEPTSVSDEAEVTEPAPSGGEQAGALVGSSSGKTASKGSGKESVGPEEPSSDTRDGESESGENMETTLPGYPYAGKSCDESDCGLATVEEHMICAAYRTTSGKKIYGCTDPKTFDKKGCYEITFYTKTGRPYSNLDTCSGEKSYVPPEPPKGPFTYWDPPEKEWSWEYRLTARWESCRRGHSSRSAPDPHCGLAGLQAKFDCAVYYDTAYGTVRGCYDKRIVMKNPGYHFEDTRVDMHLYDEAGRKIGVFRYDPKVTEESCGEDRCEIGLRVPRKWECERLHYKYSKMYGQTRNEEVRCIHPEYDNYKGIKAPKRLKDGWCAKWFDENGREIDRDGCGLGGSGANMGLHAGNNAKKADEALHNGGIRGDDTRSKGDARTEYSLTNRAVFGDGSVVGIDANGTSSPQRRDGSPPATPASAVFTAAAGAMPSEVKVAVKLVRLAGERGVELVDKTLETTLPDQPVVVTNRSSAAHKSSGGPGGKWEKASAEEGAATEEQNVTDPTKVEGARESDESGFVVAKSRLDSPSGVSDRPGSAHAVEAAGAAPVGRANASSEEAKLLTLLAPFAAITSLVLGSRIHRRYVR